MTLPTTTVQIQVRAMLLGRLLLVMQVPSIRLSAYPPYVQMR